MTTPRSVASQRGSFMLEALIGILIFSFGVLGVVGLQAQSIRHMNDAQYRGEAVYLANALIASMWSDNPAGLAAKYGNGGDGYNAFAQRVARLPGGDANKPVITVVQGPSSSSSLVTVQVFWQLPGESSANRHNYTTTAVVGLNP